MQLKIKRSQKSSMMNKIIFVLDARVDLTQEERHLIDKYKLGKEVVFSSANAERHVNEGRAALAAETVGGLGKGMVKLAMARLSLSITIDSLTKGHHLELKDLGELLGAEEAIMQGCQNVRGYLDVAATFDGRETVIDFEPEADTVAA
tara:strand:- start:293 stop:736 length:444 start_codon:yes stop_codon:yes gene_type:complete